MDEDNHWAGPPVEVLDIVARDIVSTAYHLAGKEGKEKILHDRVKLLLQAQAKGNFIQSVYHIINWLDSNGMAHVSEQLKERFLNEINT